MSTPLAFPGTFFGINYAPEHSDSYSSDDIKKLLAADLQIIGTQFDLIKTYIKVQAIGMIHRLLLLHIL